MDHRREENVLFFRFLAGDTAALQELKTLLWDTAEHTIARMLQLTSDLAKRLMHSTWRYAERHGHSRYDPRYGFLDWFIRMACFIHNHSGMIDNQPGESRMVDSGQTAVA